MADENTVNSSVTITFATSTAGAGGSIYVELDEEKHIEVYGSSKSSFLFGEVAYFSILTDPIDMGYEIIVSDGVLADQGNGLYSTPADEPLIATFADAKTASFPKPVDLVTSYSWLGNALGNISYDRRGMTISEQGVGVLEYFIRSAFARKSISLANPGGGVTSYPVLVLIKEVVDDAG